MNLDIERKFDMIGRIVIGMPSYIIHLAVAKEYLKSHTEENTDEFIRGVIAPDLLEKPQSHYGESSSEPDLKKYIQVNGLHTSYDRGYYLHLKTDWIFYHDLLPANVFCEEVYNDYDRMNASLIKKYELIIPEEVKDYVGFRDGRTKKLHEHMVDRFIGKVGKLDLEQLP